MKEVKKGSCLCEGIQFEYSGIPQSFTICHCKMCQKFSGTPFGAFVTINKSDLNITKGKELIVEFKSSDWAKRMFCDKCGSSIMYFYEQTPKQYSLAAGLFDDDIGIKPEKHIFVKDKCSWFEISDKIPQIEKY